MQHILPGFPSAHLHHLLDLLYLLYLPSVPKMSSAITHTATSSSQDSQVSISCMLPAAHSSASCFLQPTEHIE
jgi:hypothetical protein